VRIEFYGQIGEAFGGPVEVPVPQGGIQVSGLRSLLARKCDADAILNKSVRACVNDEIVPEDQWVMAGDRVEFLSPFSGG